MFDDLDAKTNPQINPTPAVGVGPGRPGPSALRPAEDIFAETDKGEKPEIFKPRPAGSPATTAPVIPEEYTWKKNRLLVFGLPALGVVILLGGYIILKVLMDKNAAPAAPAVSQEQTGGAENSVSQPPAAPAAGESELPAQPPSQAATEQSQAQETVAPPPPPDTDGDGLTDEEERALGTNPNIIDTDGDGLTDREEAKVYLTDPLKADTDGDGYVDGEEIRNGFDPKGPGKLLKIMAQ